MADTVKSSSDLKIVWSFADNDDRTLTLPNPKDDLTVEELKTVATLAKTSQAVLGDKTSAAVVGIKDAAIVSKTKLDLDLTLLDD